ncbi:MAG: ATP-dependent DNA ligase [Nitrosopumilus sp.]|uniref:ATP-dependent DNA ligase n=1 Tax=Candidatus Nitrosomaritimum aestuariumsis TaxID=3342354 RepID=A0AC60W6N0_9ARCH|nr:ATP-dependent DNA ligase [Nitrosopumilaceae archaeon]MBA4460893.1 ATP-dependent DNA ligase [Nitrosopumilaceae archaeon]MBA4462913.1 ATP-dependent DNA ligase [Nitrosopumilaceae archaeon]NCF22786.1 ATP-dependent DNA ligase [Nitrosopumilaceae archaeon]
MKYSILAESLNRMESTTKRLELTQHLVELFEKTPEDVISKIVYLLQGKLRPDFEGIELGVAEKLAIRAIAKSSGIAVNKIEQEYRKTGDLGQAATKILEQKTQTTFLVEDISVERVYETLFKIAKLEGARSQDMKMKYISSLLNDATPLEASYILKILLGTLRLGVAENTVMDALAIAYTGSKDNRKALEHAYNVSSDLGKVAQTIAGKGLKGVEEFQIAMFNPIRPMLADRVKSEEESIEKMGEEFAAEYKLDGERVQLHVEGEKVVLFSRSLENISEYYPDIIEKIPKCLAADQVILEAEAVAINENTGEFLPFQELMHRRRKYKIEKAVSQYPITVNFFDVLFYNGKSCLESDYGERRKLLEKIVKEDDFAKHIPMTIVKTEDDVEDFLENSINSGCEGLMLKMLDKPYQAGSRGNYWLKLKREYRNELGDSLDLVVVGAFFGKGRRTGRYGTLLLASYDSDTDTFTSICKVGTGFTDEYLDQLYQILSDKVTLKKNPRINSEMEADVWFEPELVIEIVASEITLSPIHKAAWDEMRKGAGLALRFPKFTGKIRVEKFAEDASTNEEVIALYKGQKKIAHDKSLM